MERDARSFAKSEPKGLYNLKIESERRLPTFLLIVVMTPVLLGSLMGVVMIVRRDKRVAAGINRKADSGS